MPKRARQTISVTDITELKRGEEAIARLASIVTYSDDAIISKDLDGVITSWNRGAERIFGYTAEEAIGKPVLMLIPEDLQDEEPKILERIRRGESVEHYETVRKRKDGKQLDISLTVSPIKDEAGRVIGASKVARDVSGRVAMENRIKRQAKALADESRRKDEFLAMLSHELRNPLAPIRSAVHLLRTQEKGSENLFQKQAHDIIERQVSNMTKLVNDLLELSRVISGRIRIDLQVLDMNQVVQHAVETASPLIKQRKHVLRVNLSERPLWVNADAVRLEEVFVNLLNNAAKYTPDGGQIEVWCERPRGTSVAQFRIRDNGVGIEKELLPRIFDLFTQADKSLDRTSGGLGIGLSLSQKLVELHDGTIEAASPPKGMKNGTELTVQLGLAAPSSKPDEPTSQNGKQSAAGVRVLVVDDNVDHVTTLTAMLRNFGYSVQWAHSGQDGLTIAKDWRPDILLLDIGLPGLDGYEVAKQLRDDPAMGNSGKKVRIIAVSGYGRESDINRGREAGFDAHLTKPADFEEIQKVIDTFSLS